MVFHHMPINRSGKENCQNDGNYQVKVGKGQYNIGFRNQSMLLKASAKANQLQHSPKTGEDEDEDDIEANNKKSDRTIKGLRALSLRVRDIVYKRRISTYQNVAAVLIEQID